MPENNWPARRYVLLEQLTRWGYEIDNMMQEGIDEDGYELVVKGGSPVTRQVAFDGRLVTERKEWKSPEHWEFVKGWLPLGN